MLLRDSPKMSKVVTACLSSLPGLCPPSLLQDLTLISLFPKDMCNLKIKHLTFHDTMFQRIAWTCSLLRAVELGICKDSRQGLGLLWSLTRKVEKETHVANTLIITLIIALGKHPDHHTEFACLRQLLLRMRLQEAISEGSVDRRKSTTDIPWQDVSKNCLDMFIAKSSGTRHLQGLTARSGTSLMPNPKSGKGNSRGKHTDHHTEFACLLQLPFWFWGPARPLVSARWISCCFCRTFCYFWSSPVCLHEMT